MRRGQKVKMNRRRRESIGDTADGNLCLGADYWVDWRRKRMRMEIICLDFWDFADVRAFLGVSGRLNGWFYIRLVDMLVVWHMWWFKHRTFIASQLDIMLTFREPAQSPYHDPAKINLPPPLPSILKPPHPQRYIHMPSRQLISLPQPI